MTPAKSPSLPEYIILIALMVSIVAMATDVMLPALDEIGVDLNVARANDVQLVVSAFFLGLAFGQLVVGPLSDSYGRKPVIYASYGVFLIGCLISMLTDSWALMLIGRVLQGLGAAGPRVVTLALVRDSYAGRDMARIMSIVMAVFILVPVLAPAIGQGLITLGGWRATFLGLLAPALVAFIWFALRLPETLPQANRRAFSLHQILGGVVTILRTRAALGYTLATGLIFGLFLGYLSSAEQIFTEVFASGDFFVVYFAIAALAIGAASITNAALVMRYGMRRLVHWALIGLIVLAAGALIPVTVFAGVPPLWLFMAWQLASFFCIGILFGNLTALAMEPLGNMAGLGAAFVGALSTFMSLPLGWAVGAAFNHTVYPLILGFGALALAALIICLATEGRFSRGGAIG